MDEHLINEMDFVEWSPRPDTDTFFIYLRYYYGKRSILNIYISYIKTFVNTLCTIFLIIFLFDIFKWNNVKVCKDINSCNISLIDYRWTPFRIFYLIMMSVSTILYIIRIQKEMKIYYTIHFFLINNSITNIKDLTWEQLINAIKSKKPKIHGKYYDVHTVNNIIMRKENILIALITSNQLPLWCLSRISEYPIKEVIIDTWLYESQNYSKIMLKRSKCIGILFLVLCPFTIIYTFAFLLMKHVSDIKEKSIGILFKRHIRYGHSYLLRRFNELDDAFEVRKESIEKLCDTMLNSIETPLQDLCKDCLFTFFACIFLFLLCISTANDLIIIYVLWPSDGFSLLWWFAFVSSMLAILDMKKEKKENLNFEEELDIPINIKYLYPFRIIDMFSEIFACFLSCVVLLIYVPNRVNKIKEALNACTITTDLGVMCRYSQFTDKNTDSLNAKVNEKMRQSVYDFQISNPKWFHDTTSTETLHTLDNNPIVDSTNSTERLIIEHAYQEILSSSDINTSYEEYNDSRTITNS